MVEKDSASSVAEVCERLPVSSVEALSDRFFSDDGDDFASDIDARHEGQEVGTVVCVQEDQLSVQRERET
ncbi:hypothetical protein TSUD_368250 [Trifolium subterraneum]|uniref:Uncharacterized protein n=1 Tax=Trifolium subterraneum TaxID=3900 RepID=A0A2Z6MKY7_TRISU|nr:hypothetical protein TSUD_368250 [Trifolium subterraneum]